MSLNEALPIILPLAILEIFLAVFSLIHVLRHPNYRFGNKMIWCIIVVFLQFIGPIIYFVFGRGDQE
ncbi:PLDc N-terminal domain-containing protein [Absiella sp. AM29-15]|uniref:PLDc N-terminal domain-containing protein n=1 Tax=Absiella sp. AM29-15 TaxID=2292278 RepID=UPI000E3FA7C7|nr:PLD nuclease N-terminal domain-containing protein [Absiella sp. AM29-15]RGC47749.1 PLDc_N domain-containing protein [Absiella sp. AM29-15]